ncbi:MAG: PKD domain-containing protein [Flavobacteriales bacterium]
MANCKNCGTLNYEGAASCSSCGRELENAGVNASSTTSQQASASAEETSGKSKSKLIIIIASALLIIGGIVFFILSRGEEIVVSFKVSPDSIYPGTQVTFTDLTEGATSWDWDFGDGRNESVLERIVYHTYEWPGDYMVKLKINGNYIDSMKVTVIDNSIKPVEEEAEVIIEGPNVVTVGEEVTFTDKTPGATTAEWQFGETGVIDRNGLSVTYIFNLPNNQAEVRLTNDATKKIGIYPIVVKRKSNSGGVVIQTDNTSASKTPEPKSIPPPPKADNKPATSSKPVMNTKQVMIDFEGTLNQYRGKSVNYFNDLKRLADNYCCGDMKVAVEINKSEKTDLSALMGSGRFENNKVIVNKVNVDAEGCVTKIELTKK